MRGQRLGVRLFVFASYAESHHLFLCRPAAVAAGARTCSCRFCSCVPRAWCSGCDARHGAIRCPPPMPRHNGVTLSFEHTWQGAASPHAKPFPVSRRRGDPGRALSYRRTVRHGGVLRARAEGDIHARAGRQGAPLDPAGSPTAAGWRTLMRAAPSARAGSGSLAPGLLLRLPRVAAQDSWNPFKQNAEPASDAPRPENAARDAEPARPRQRATDPRAGRRALASPRGGTVERGELAPVMAPDASGLPLELWRGLDLKTLEELLAGLDLPPRSPALHQLWRRMLLSSATPPAGAPIAEHFVALRLEALYRSGPARRHGDACSTRAAPPDPSIAGAAGAARHRPRPARGGLPSGQGAGAPSSGLPGRLKGETQLLAGYCAAVAGDAQGAGLAAELAREEGIDAELPLAVLAGVAAGSKPQAALAQARAAARLPLPRAAGRRSMRAQIFDKAEPALLARLPGDIQAEPRLQIAAAEAALRLNALPADAVADDLSPPSAAAAAGRSGGADQPTAAAARAVLPGRRSWRRRRRSAPASCAPCSTMRADRGTSCRWRGCWPRCLPSCDRQPDLGMVRRDGDRDRAGGRRTSDRARRGPRPPALRHWLALIDIADPAAARRPAAGLAADRGAGDARPARRRCAAPAGDRARRARHRRADRAVGRGEPHAASLPPAICPRPACWPISAQSAKAQRGRPHASCWSCARSGPAVRRAPTCWRSAMRCGP